MNDDTSTVNSLVSICPMISLKINLTGDKRIFFVIIFLRSSTLFQPIPTTTTWRHCSAGLPPSRPTTRARNPGGTRHHRGKKLTPHPGVSIQTAIRFCSVLRVSVAAGAGFQEHATDPADQLSGGSVWRVWFGGLMLARVSSDGHGDDEAIAIVLCFIVIGRT